MDISMIPKGIKLLNCVTLLASWVTGPFTLYGGMVTVTYVPHHISPGSYMSQDHTCHRTHISQGTYHLMPSFEEQEIRPCWDWLLEVSRKDWDSERRLAMRVYMKCMAAIARAARIVSILRVIFGFWCERRRSCTNRGRHSAVITNCHWVNTLAVLFVIALSRGERSDTMNDIRIEGNI